MPMFNDFDDIGYDDQIDDDYYEHRRPCRPSMNSDNGPVWNGQSIRCMDSSHIKNVLMMLERKWTTALDNYIRTNGSQFGFYYSSIEHMFPVYRYLKAELNLREPSTRKRKRAR